jgi:diguanylate cyclase (GGDEF)-like protein
MVLLALAGLCGSWIAARRAAQVNAQHSREVFRLAAAQVDASLDLEVQHETDLLTGAAAFLQDHPGRRPGSFQRWTDDVHARKRYPELIALAEIWPAPGRSGGCPLVTLAAAHWATTFSALVGQDICASTYGLQASRDSGGMVDFGYDPVGLRFMGAATPVYRTAGVPPTVAGRRREFLGWAGIATYPDVLLRNALRGFPGVEAQIETRDNARLTFSAGPRVRAGMSMTDVLSNGLEAIVTGAVQSESIFDDRSALSIMIGGSTLSALLALAIFLLGTGRARAMNVVDEKTRELAFQALHDGLTGLPNRTLVMDRIGHALARTRRGAPPVALLFIDADGFKTVNDTFGHGAGDELLRTIGARLSELVRGADTVGRLAGDEFVVLLEPGDGVPAPERVAERILELFNKPVNLGQGTEVRLTASIGIAASDGAGTEDLLRDADLALYSAKQSGRNRYVVFEDAMRAAIADRYSLEIDLKHAVTRDELFLVYQPTFRLDDRRIGGVEALVRWQHPARGLIAPDRFIPIAEESGLILELGRWVAREACAQAAAWRKRGLALTMAINISGKQLDEHDFTGEIRTILEETGLDPEALTLEITESSLMRSPGDAAARLRELKGLGVRIAIDDFGTGYSSLAYLREFPVDSLKIDRTFISSLGSSQDASALVATLVQLGKSLKVSTLGEGIEDESQLNGLRDADCDYGQGFLLARPLPADGIEAMILDGRFSAGHTACVNEDVDSVQNI